jgi:hypothetical protein
MTQGEALSRTIKQHFNETLTWEQYKAAKENAKRR